MSLLLVEGFQGIASADIVSRYTPNAGAGGVVASTTPRYTGSHVNGSNLLSYSFWLGVITWPLYIEQAVYKPAITSGAGLDLLAELYGWQGVNSGSTSAAYFGGLYLCPGGIIILLNKAGTVLAQSLVPIRCGAWTHLQIYWNIVSRANNAVGQVIVYDEGAEILNYDGALVNNPNEGSNVLNQSEVTSINLNGVGDAVIGTQALVRHTDIVICDSAGSDHNGFQGDVMVETIRPNGAGNYTDFTPSAGSNYQNVDETTPDGDTTYNSSGTLDHKDSYAMSALASVTGAVKAVMLNANIRTPEAALIQAKLLLRASGVDAESVAFNVNRSYLHRRAAFNTDGDGSAWTIAKVNAMEAGVHRL